MGTLTQRPPIGDGLSRPFFGGFSLKHRTPSPARRKLFPDSPPRSLATPIPENGSYAKTSSSYSYSSTSDTLPPRKFSGLVSSLEESSRRSSRATSPFDDYSSRRSSRATSPYSEDSTRYQRSSRSYRKTSYRETSPFDADVSPYALSEAPMQSFIDSLRSRTPSPSGLRHSRESSQRRSSSVFSDSAVRRMSNSPYATLPRRRSQSPDVRSLSVASDYGPSSLPPPSRASPFRRGSIEPSPDAPVAPSEYLLSKVLLMLFTKHLIDYYIICH